MPYFNNKNLFLIHIPKTGGTSLEQYFKKNNNDNIIFFGNKIKINNHTQQHCTYQELNQFGFNDEKTNFITVVRNPYDRAFSTLFFNNIIDDKSSKEDIELRLKLFLDDIFIYGNHKLEQYKFLIDENSQIINSTILKTENLTNDMKSLGYDDFNMHEKNNTKDYELLLTEKIINMIDQYYKKDFEYFGYKMKPKYDDVNSFFISETRLLFFDIFHKDNNLYLICPRYKPTSTEEINSIISSITIKYKDIKLKNCGFISDFNINQTLILGYEFQSNYIVNDITVEYDGIEKQYSLLNRKTTTKNILSLTTLFKDDYELIDPFYKYYDEQGVEMFYLYYNGKIDNIDIEKFNKYNIILIEWDFYYRDENNIFPNHAQKGQVNHALWKYGKDNFEYMIFCDFDEYLYVENKTLFTEIIDNDYECLGFCNIWSKSEIKNNHLEDFMHGDKFIFAPDTGPKCIHKVSLFNIVDIHVNLENMTRGKFNYDKYHFYNWSKHNRIRDVKYNKSIVSDNKIIKQIYILWFQGFEHTPYLVKKCVDSWKYYNPDWIINLLDQNNINKYININDHIDLSNKKLSYSALSDIYRVLLLKKYGGLWVDATTFCNKSLNEWLNNHIQNGFFAFSNPGPDRLISSWFIYSSKNNYILNRLVINVLTFIKTKNEIEEYFWFHYLFNYLYLNNNKIKFLWNETNKLESDKPHLLQKIGMFSQITNEIKTIIDSNIPIFKLNHHENFNSYNDKCILNYLFNKIDKIIFVHIGKTGGTSIMDFFNIKQIHHIKVIFNQDKNYITWIRNPLSRFVSAFNMEYDTKELDPKFKNITNLNEINLDNTIDTHKTKRFLTNSLHDYEIRCNELFKYFDSANKLAESLSSSNEKIKKEAQELINICGHTHKGIGWYFDNGEFIEKHHQNILMVGRMEHMDEDIKKLKTFLPCKHYIDKIRVNKSNSSKYLSELAITNLLEYYKDTDYKTLHIMEKYGFIDNETLNSYYKYN